MMRYWIISILFVLTLFGWWVLAQAGSNTLAWDPYVQNPTDLAVSFTLRWAMGANCQSILTISPLATGLPILSTTYTHTNLAGNQTYCYSLTAVDAAGVESMPANCAGQPLSIPPVCSVVMPQVAGPVNLSGSVSGNAISLFWAYAPATANPSIGTQVLRSTNGAPAVQLTTLTPTSVQHTDMGAPGNTYTYSLQTVDSGGGTSVATAALTFRVQSAPSPVNNLRTTVGP